MGINLHGLTSREKTMVIDALKDRYPLAQLLQGLKPACSTYFYQRLCNDPAESAQIMRLKQMPRPGFSWPT
ncbi:hypothetical protein V0R37_19390, partial [Pollutimonas sp. H1-120]